MLARMLRRRSMTPPRRVGRRRRLTRRARRLAIEHGEARDLVEILGRERGEVPVHQDLALALARHLERLAVVGRLPLPSPRAPATPSARRRQARPAAARPRLSAPAPGSSSPSSPCPSSAWNVQNASKQRSKAGISSTRATRQARSARYTSWRSSRSTTSRARTASISSDTVRGSPARRSVWPKRSVAVRRSRGARHRRPDLRSPRPARSA